MDTSAAVVPTKTFSGATVNHLTSGLATVAATCQQGSERMLEVLVGDVDGPVTQIGDTRN